MSFEEEFATVELIEASGSETRGVDAFALCIIKAERQLRRLFTYAVFQYPCFSKADVPALREVLTANRQIYAEGFMAGFNGVCPRTIEQLIGPDFHRLHNSFKEATCARNKIFHGQLTPRRLSRANLLHYIVDIKQWCRLLAENAVQEIGYDGFTRPSSYRKSSDPRLHERFRVQLASVAEFEALLRTTLAR